MVNKSTKVALRSLKKLHDILTQEGDIHLCKHCNADMCEHIDPLGLFNKDIHDQRNKAEQVPA